MSARQAFEIARRARTALVTATALALLGISARPAGASNHPAPLLPLPEAALKGLAPLLRDAELALIEQNDKGLMKQITTIALAAAPPEVVREVVIHPERYADFVRNMTESRVVPEEGGTFVHHYKISYTIYTVDGRHRYRMEDPPTSGGVGPVDLTDPDEGGLRHYRFEFIPVAGGTLVVLYGQTQIPRDGFMSKLLTKAPTIEYGLALTTQMTLLLAMKGRAEALAKVALPRTRGAVGSYEFLLDRGTVALFRHPPAGATNRIGEIALVDHTRARPEVLVKVAAEPAGWPGFVPTVGRATPMASREGLSTVEVEQSLPLVSWTTQFAHRSDGSSVDLFGLKGDLSGGRLRWDVRPRGEGRNELSLRAQLAYDKGSMVIRQLYKLEPLFEYGIDVGLALVLHQSIRWQAERLTTSRATR